MWLVHVLQPPCSVQGYHKLNFDCSYRINGHIRLSRKVFGSLSHLVDNIYSKLLLWKRNSGIGRAREQRVSVVHKLRPVAQVQKKGGCSYSVNVFEQPIRCNNTLQSEAMESMVIPQLQYLSLSVLLSFSTINVY